MAGSERSVRTTLELTLNPEYVRDWGVWEALREFLQNALDGDDLGSLFHATADPDVYNDSQTYTAQVTGVTGGNYENFVPSAAVTANVSDDDYEDETTTPTDENAIDETPALITVNHEHENAHRGKFNSARTS